MKISNLIFIFLSLFPMFNLQGETSKSYYKDISEVTIGTQVWMAENLDVKRFRNGDPIPQVKSLEEWRQATDNEKPAWCHYENDSDNGTKYGKLYNWYALNDPRGLAPKGWHLPNSSEWQTLIKYLGGSKEAARKIKSNTGWKLSGNGNNESGFFGLPAGYRDYGTFYQIGLTGRWWSSTSINEMYAYQLNLNFDDDANTNIFIGQSKDRGCSVRCIKD